jgi:hypothetical protein
LIIGGFFCIFEVLNNNYKKIHMKEKNTNNGKTILKKLEKLEDFPFFDTIMNESIEMLENDVNPDKVYNWVVSVRNIYFNKPKPISEREKNKRAERIRKKAEKKAKITHLNQELSQMVANLGLELGGFFDWKEVKAEDIDFLETKLLDFGYNMYQWEGAFFISKLKMNEETRKMVWDKQEEVEELNGKPCFDFIYDYDKFKTMAYKLIK